MPDGEKRVKATRKESKPQMMSCYVIEGGVKRLYKDFPKKFIGVMAKEMALSKYKEFSFSKVKKYTPVDADTIIDSKYKD